MVDKFNIFYGGVFLQITEIRFKIATQLIQYHYNTMYVHVSVYYLLYLLCLYPGRLAETHHIVGIQ